MKKNKDKIYKDLKLYNMVMSNIWKLITFILLGILAGYLLDKYATYHDINYMLFSILLFVIIGVTDFFVSIIRECKRLDEAERKKQELLKTKNLENTTENNENEDNTDFK